MKIFFKKIYITIFLINILIIPNKALSKETKIEYTSKNISNYFLGIISSDQHYNDEAFKYLNKVKKLKNKHSRFNVEFIRTLVLLDKFDEAFDFSKEISSKEGPFFEADLLLGLDFFLKKDYDNAKKYFIRLNKTSLTNPFFEDFIGNVLLAWNSAAQENREESFKYLKKIPQIYSHLTEIQNIFLQSYFEDKDSEKKFEELINNKNYNFTRYNFFLVNYLLSKNKINEANKVINNNKKTNNSNILIKQTNNFLLQNNLNKITNLFNNQDPKDILGEFFYVLANLFSSEQDYQTSNFYLKISLFLNKKFLPNKALLAENLFYQKKYDHSKSIYDSLKKIGSVYSWHSAKSISKIFLITKSKEHSKKSLEKEFKSLPGKNFEHYFELANFYKDNEYYEESIKNYSLTLKKIKKNHILIPKILERRGSSYERIGKWEEGEKDLIKSLEIIPDQPYVLNYLAYTWIDKGINLDKGLEMLKKASKLKENDGYIIDSLGWAYYAKKNYVEAEEFLRQAVELLPTDPIINDHYADALWMLNKNIQARYVWNYVLKLDQVEEKLKDNINKKLIFGISNKL